MKDTIRCISVEVGSFSSPYSVFYSKTFKIMHDTLRKEEAIEIVKLIKTGKLDTRESLIGIQLIYCSFNEIVAWEILFPLLDQGTKTRILEEVLNPAFPIGSGYANAYNNAVYKKQLEKLYRDESIPKNIKEMLLSILIGEHAKQYKEFLIDPLEFNYEYRSYRYLGKE